MRKMYGVFKILKIRAIYMNFTDIGASFHFIHR